MLNNFSQIIIDVYVMEKNNSGLYLKFDLKKKIFFGDSASKHLHWRSTEPPPVVTVTGSGGL